MTNGFEKHVEQIAWWVSPFVFLQFSQVAINKTVKHVAFARVLSLVCRILAVAAVVLLLARSEYKVYQTEGTGEVVNDVLIAFGVGFALKYAQGTEAKLNRAISKLFRRSKR